MAAAYWTCNDNNHECSVTVVKVMCNKIRMLSEKIKEALPGTSVTLDMAFSLLHVDPSILFSSLHRRLA